MAILFCLAKHLEGYTVQLLQSLVEVLRERVFPILNLVLVLFEDTRAEYRVIPIKYDQSLLTAGKIAVM